MDREYRCVATSLEGFVQQVAVSYVRNGYWFYVAGSIPEGISPSRVDHKLLRTYGIEISKFVRCRQKRLGAAAVQYIRLGRFFLLLATHGEHVIFGREQSVMRDARRSPIRVDGYSIGFQQGRVSVRLDKAEYRILMDTMLARCHRPREHLEAVFSNLPYEPYAPIRSQLLAVLRAVNRRRTVAGFSPLDRRCVRTLRRIVRPFE